MAIKRGIESAVGSIVSELQGMSQPVETRERIGQVASLSAHEDAIGETIAEAMEKVGKDGVITVEESRGLTDEIEYVEGMQVDRGYISPYFITNSDRMEASIDDVSIIITDKKISAVADLVPALEKLLQAGQKNVVIVGEDIDGEALATLVVNKLRGIMNVLAVKAPWLRRPPQGHAGRHRHPHRRHRHQRGNQPSPGLRHHRGLRPSPSRCFHQGCHHHRGRSWIGVRQSRLASTRSRPRLKTPPPSTTAKSCRSGWPSCPAASLSSRLAPATEIELKERKARVEDALSATRSAVEEGIVPGGGVALVRAQRALDSIEGLTVDEFVGVNIIRRALEQPLKLIVENAGSEGAVVLNQVQHQSDDYGYDAELGEFGPMLERGIIDPVKVTRSALQNAASVAAMVLTTESMITEIPEPMSAAGAPPPMDF